MATAGPLVLRESGLQGRFQGLHGTKTKIAPISDDRLRKAGRMDPAESKRTDDRAREDLSEHCRKLEALENFSDDLGSKKDCEQLEEKFLRAVVHGIGG